MSEKPHRRYELTITIGADTYEDLMAHLIDWTRTMRLDYPDLDYSTHGVSAGHSAAINYKIDFDPDMDHERYFEELNAYLDEQKAGDE